MSLFDHLPNELIVSIITVLPIRDLVRLGRTCHRLTAICRDPDLWSQRAFREVGYPHQAFHWLFWLDWTPLYRYHHIQTQMIPTHEVLTGLNEMALHWNVKTNRWCPDSSIYINPDLRRAFNLYDTGLTITQAEELIQSLTSKLRTQFMSNQHIYLHGTLVETFVIPKMIHVPYSSRTLHYNPSAPYVSYLEILTATCALIPIKVHALIPKYSFDGFSSEGYPILKVTFIH
jgi:hypothetical protein